MGGYGSGLYGSGPMIGKTAAENCRSIDVRRWQRENLLFPGSPFSWAWYDAGGNPAASISIIPKRDHVILAYKANGKTIETIVYLSDTKTGFGQRKWFCCPGCGGRVAILYVKGIYFKCRKCHNLNYRSSQLSGDMAYYHKQLEKLCERFKAKYDPTSSLPPDKPKGMHWKTYERYVERYLQLVEKRRDCFIAEAKRILK